MKIYFRKKLHKGIQKQKDEKGQTTKKTQTKFKALLEKRNKRMWISKQNLIQEGHQFSSVFNPIHTIFISKKIHPTITLEQFSHISY